LFTEETEIVAITFHFSVKNIQKPEIIPGKIFLYRETAEHFGKDPFLQKRGKERKNPFPGEKQLYFP
jgi:hypothetical protein